MVLRKVLLTTYFESNKPLKVIKNLTKSYSIKKKKRKEVYLKIKLNVSFTFKFFTV